MAGAAMTKPNQSAISPAKERDHDLVLRMGINVLRICRAVH